MPIGLKRGTVKLADHDPEWATLATETITKLNSILGDIAVVIQHVGSTSINEIKAKPIIDIAVAVKDLNSVRKMIPALEQAAFLLRKWPDETQMLFACGDYTKLDGIVTHFIHVVKVDSKEWKDYIHFRDYLNANPLVAREYEVLKVSLMNKNLQDKGREKYLDGKHDFVVHTLRKAQVWSFLGKTVTVTVDRPIGTAHPEHQDIIYPINYGYIAGEIAPDGKNLDAYILGMNKPLSSFTGRVVAIIHRENDVEDKLVVAPQDCEYNQAEIAEAVNFQEQYYKSHIELMKGINQ